MSKARSKLKKAKGTKDTMNTEGVSNALKHFMTHKNGDYLEASLDKLTPDPDQPRKEFDKDKLEELSNSIKDKGVLQPLLIRFTDNQFWIVAGERRYRAAKLAGLTSVPCIVTTGAPEEISIIENIQREDLKPIELAEALQSMMKKHKYTQAQLGKILGKKQSTISEILSINKLADKLKEEYRHADISQRTFVEVVKEDPEKAEEILNQVESHGIASPQIRDNRRTQAINRRTDVEIINDKILLLTKTLEKVEDPRRIRVKLRPALEKLRTQFDRFLN